MSDNQYRQPVSVLVVVYSPDGRFLLLERCYPKGVWQSVTGGVEWGETPRQSAIRELWEETGICISQAQLELKDHCSQTRYTIMPQWQSRYAPDTKENTEHLFSVCVPQNIDVVLAEQEHTSYCWLDAAEAMDKVFSATNRQAIAAIAGLG
ncbi:dihydroneopterin triphosphate diphosphatase [Shewanella submarina]|uniref:Dihydroneopterin triphosphate diphosphatase n=1 Tax=Shewanella submarina TaxID=2016376 RepID=A0ABV7GBA6_9GAMM|nr:dihydroneopterin triphosphate diphosphatase [Shewanella submarina]MCL1037305.1 dihydroneopterin triphosphate diphosphatase [Shewanella submarina]